MSMKGKISDALLYLVAFVMIQLLVTYAVYFCWAWAGGQPSKEILSSMANGTMPMTAIQTIVIQTVFSVIVLVVFLALRWSRVSRSYLKSKPVGVLFWSAIAALGTIIPSEVFLELVSLPDLSSEVLREVMTTRGGYLAVCIFAPLVEELVFRGAILRVLLDGMRHHWGAIVVSALIFAVVHVNPAQMPHAFCIGLLIGWMYYRTRSVIPGIMLHWVNNTVAYAVCVIYPQYQDARVIDLMGGSYLKVGLAVVFSLMIFLPAVAQLHQRLRRADE